MRLNINRVLLVIFVVLLGIGGFYTIGQSQDKGTSEPRVTIIGNPAELPQRIKNDLPTGYSSLSSETASLPDSRASDENDPTIVFLLNPRDPESNMKEQMEYARNMGKTEVFFLIEKERDPNVPVSPFTMDDLVKTIQGLDLYSIDIDDMIFDFLITPAYANSVKGSNCGGTRVPPDTCNSASFTDDDTSDGKTPGFTVCIKYNGFSCHLDSMFDHLKKNIAVSSTQSCNHTSSNGSPCPWVDCMKAENTSSFIKAPVNLSVRLYFDENDFKSNGELGCTGPNLCGCADTPGILSPRVSVDRRMAMNGQHSCSWLELMRHELAHTYGYTHGNFGSNLDKSKHCKNQHQVH